MVQTTSQPGNAPLQQRIWAFREACNAEMHKLYQQRPPVDLKGRTPQPAPRTPAPELSPNDPFSIFDAAVEAHYAQTVAAAPTVEECHESTGTIAAPDNFDHAEFTAWLDAHDFPPTAEEEAQHYAEYLADCERNADADAA